MNKKLAMEAIRKVMAKSVLGPKFSGRFADTNDVVHRGDRGYISEKVAQIYSVSRKVVVNEVDSHSFMVSCSDGSSIATSFLTAKP